MNSFARAEACGSAGRVAVRGRATDRFFVPGKHHFSVLTEFADPQSGALRNDHGHVRKRLKIFTGSKRRIEAVARKRKPACR